MKCTLIDRPYRLPWQELLGPDLQAIPAAADAAMVRYITKQMQPTFITEIKWYF